MLFPNALLFDELAQERRDRLAGLAPVGHPHGDEWDARAGGHEDELLELIFFADGGGIDAVLC